MKRASSIFLKTILIFIALGMLAALVKFPQTEGRAANLNLVQIYSDPFIIYIYLGAIPFFIAVYQAIKLLNYSDKNMLFTQSAVNTVKNIKYCALSIMGFIIGAEAFIFIVEKSKSDDIAGGVAMGVFISFVSIIVVAAMSVAQRLLQNGVDIKSENDLTV